MTNHIKIQLHLPSPADREMLIALLSEAGYQGFEEEDLGETDYCLNAFIPESDFITADLDHLLTGRNIGYSKEVIEQRNWNDEWEKDFEPVVVGSFCAIRASFHQPVAGVRFDLQITPKMSFGTGHHATTFLMVLAMGNIEFTEKRIFDFGTGTGVLSILAEKLGAGAIFAIDIDDWSIENALENVQQNDCRNVTVSKASAVPDDQQFDVVLANINKYVILASVDAISQQLKIGGVLLISGLLDDDEQSIINATNLYNLRLIRILRKDGWMAIELIKKNVNEA